MFFGGRSFFWFCLHCYKYCSLLASKVLLPKPHSLLMFNCHKNNRMIFFSSKNTLSKPSPKNNMANKKWPIKKKNLWCNICQRQSFYYPHPLDCLAYFVCDILSVWNKNDFGMDGRQMLFSTKNFSDSPHHKSKAHYLYSGICHPFHFAKLNPCI